MFLKKITFFSSARVRCDCCSQLPTFCHCDDVITNVKFVGRKLSSQLKKCSKSRSSALKETELFFKEYQQGRLLGRGGFGTVHAGLRSHDRKPVAMKYIRKSSILNWSWVDGELLPLEYALMRQVKHLDNVIRLMDAFDIGSHFVIVMERMEPSKDLFELVVDGGALIEQMARLIFRQVVRGANRCFQSGVFHRDIKAENIMVNLDTLKVKLIDFGCGTFSKKRRFTTPIGTPSYFSPELLRNGWYYGEQHTAWSLGVLLYFMVCGETPFQSKQDIIEARVEFKAPISPQCHDIILRLLDSRCEERLNLNSISLHSWMVRH